MKTKKQLTQTAFKRFN